MFLSSYRNTIIILCQPSPHVVILVVFQPQDRPLKSFQTKQVRTIYKRFRCTCVMFRVALRMQTTTKRQCCTSRHWKSFKDLMGRKTSLYISLQKAVTTGIQTRAPAHCAPHILCHVMNQAMATSSIKPRSAQQPAVCSPR